MQGPWGKTDSSVIYENIAAVVLALNVVCQPGDGGFVEQVKAGDLGRTAVHLDFALHTIQLMEVAGGKNNGGPQGGELFADGFSNAACGTGHDGHLPIEF
jgi:hypothetical protein